MLLTLIYRQAKDRNELHNALKTSLDAGLLLFNHLHSLYGGLGYRYFDTALMYGNEKDIGDFFEGVFREGKLKREDIFITTKLSFNCHAPSDAKEAIKKQLKDLKTDYIDLYLIHNQCSVKRAPDGGFLKDSDGKNVFDSTPPIETWKVLEQFYKEKKLRALGISNFRADIIQDLFNKAEIKPHNLQVIHYSII